MIKALGSYLFFNKSIRLIKGFSKWLGDFLITPFTKGIFFFSIIFLCLFLPPIFYVTGRGEFHAYSFGIFSQCFCISYLITLITGIIKDLINVTRIIIFLGISIFELINMFCVLKFSTLVDYDILTIIKGTNPKELIEFLETYVRVNEIVALLGYMLLAALLILCIKKLKFWLPIKPAMCMMALLCICCYTAYCQNLNMTKWKLKFEDVVDLSKHTTNPNLIPINAESTLPHNVVIIIGESFTPSHSSLYGYDKETNPNLSYRKNNIIDGELVVFKGVVSPRTTTSAVFKYLLNTYRVGMEENYKWYETTNLIEVFKKLGYFVSWFSSQPEAGHGSNVQSTQAYLCDKYEFGGFAKCGKDEALLEIQRSNQHAYNAVIYHLSGQHVNFKNRYPIDFNKFTPDEYSGSALQQEQLAYYDNATLYNDYVVDRLINKFEGTDAVVFYLSDHGLDLFNTDTTYFGHARKTTESQYFGKQIPFMVWMSPLYMNLHNNSAQRILSAKSEKFCTDCFIYSVMDAMGVKFGDNEDVKKFSIFSQS